MKFILLIITIMLGGYSTSSMATTCSGGDFPAICNEYADWGSTTGQSRCATESETIAGAKRQCAPQVDCRAIGGCSGFAPTGHWIFLPNIRGKKIRCRCGCWTMDTRFASSEGEIDGNDIASQLNNEGNSELEVTSFNPVQKTQSDAAINSVSIGDDKEALIIVHTEEGSVSVTAAHPIILSDEEGDVFKIVQASALKEGDFLLTEEFTPAPVTKIEQGPVGSKVINFHVGTSAAEEHFVSSNGFIFGDNAWQQKLAEMDRRILERMDVIKVIENTER